MKATELMLGDQVYCYHPSRPREVVTADADLLRLMERIESGLVTEESPLYRVIEPIPLTPEILEKNGWTRDELCNEWFIHYGPNLFGKCPEVTIFDGVSIKYVHELQHALRLCGIDKQIEL